jgi:hypothetical protein
VSDSGKRQNLAQQPLEVFLGLLVHRQRMHGILHRDRTNPLQTTPDLDAQICRLRRELMDEQELAMGKHTRSSGVHDGNCIMELFMCNMCIITLVCRAEPTPTLGERGARRIEP